MTPSMPARPAPVAEGAESVPRRVSAWRPTLWAASLCAAVLGVAHFDTYRSMVDTWRRSETFAHGFIIVPIVVWLVWRMRDDLKRLTPAPSLGGLLILALLSLVWLGGWAANVLAVQHLCAVLLVPALVFTLAGPTVTRRLAFPLAFLLFAVPIGEFFVPLLTEVTARVTVAGLRLFGVPVSQEGLYFKVPGGHWEISKACSGIRYLMSTVAVGSLFAHLHYRTPRRKLMFLGLSVIIPILANWVRAFLIVMTGYLSDMKIATGVDHIIYGWIFFSLVTIGLCWFGARWSEKSVPPEEAVRADVSAPRAASGRALVATGIAAAVILASAPATAQQLDRVTHSALPRPALLAPPADSPWSGPYDTDDTWQPRFIDPDRRARKVYRRGSDAVQYFAAFYSRQKQGAELINSQNRVYDPKSWRRIAEVERSVSLGGRTLRVIETSLYLDSAYRAQRRLVWHWYVVSGSPTTNPYLAKFLDARARMQASSVGSAAVAVASDYSSRPEAARDVLKEFLAANLDEMEKGLKRLDKTEAR